MNDLILRAVEAISKLAQHNSSAAILVRFFGFHTCMINFKKKILINCHFLIPHLSLIIRWICRMEGGIPLLVELLDAYEIHLQGAAAAALCMLALESKENRNQVVTF